MMMQFSRLVTELIRIRKSTRTFDGREPDLAAHQALLADIDAINSSQVIKGRFILTDTSDSAAGKPLKLGTYGIITGARCFLIGLVDAREKDALTFGNLFEQLILRATDLGLETCWLGGTFSKSDLARDLVLSDHEYIAAVSPVGYGKEKPRFFESVMRAVAGADKRKPWSEIFFTGDSTRPLAAADAGDYATPLEMLRLAPSASNKQPWRVVADGNRLHFYLCRTPGYGITGFDLQLNDIGIAKCHFELTAQEVGLDGRWQVLENVMGPAGWEYITSWTRQ